MKLVRASILALSIGLMLAIAAPAAAGGSFDEYDPQHAGNPLRVAAYILHPVGVIVDYLVFRPAWWIGGFEPIRTLVGREPSIAETTFVPEPPVAP